MRRAYQSVLLPLSALVLLAGCATVGPDYSPPSLSALHSSGFPTSFGEQPSGLGYGTVEVEWWRALEDPALTTLIQRALAKNHDIGVAAMRVEEAKAVLGEERQGFLPRGGAALGHENLRRSAIETPPGQPRRTQTYRGAIDASWGAAGSTLGLRLLESGATREAARLARLRFSAGEGDYLNVLEAERADLASRRALAVARTDQRLAIVSIYKALGGGWEICASLDHDCGGADGVPNLHSTKQAIPKS